MRAPWTRAGHQHSCGMTCMRGRERLQAGGLRRLEPCILYIRTQEHGRACVAAGQGNVRQEQALQAAFRGVASRCDAGPPPLGRRRQGEQAAGAACREPAQQGGWGARGAGRGAAGCAGRGAVLSGVGQPGCAGLRVLVREEGRGESRESRESLPLFLHVSELHAGREIGERPWSRRSWCRCALLPDASTRARERRPTRSAGQRLAPRPGAAWSTPGAAPWGVITPPGGGDSALPCRTRQQGGGAEPEERRCCCSGVLVVCW